VTIVRYRTISFLLDQAKACDFELADQVREGDGAAPLPVIWRLFYSEPGTACFLFLFFRANALSPACKSSMIAFTWAICFVNLSKSFFFFMSDSRFLQPYRA
jgi:hypothetical protein